MSDKIPRFSSEDEERAFWERADSTDHVDWNLGRKVAFPKLKPSVKTISLRLPEMMLDQIRILANRMDVPYQSLMKIFLAERIEKEMGRMEPEAGDRSAAAHDRKVKYGKGRKKPTER